MKKAFLYLLKSLLLISTGCAYFDKKNCENKNWFQHGKSIALRGERITGDGTLLRCQKLEATVNSSELDKGWKAGQSEYCSLEGAFNTGREGSSLKVEICSTEQISTLRKRHLEGLNIHCQPENGFELGRKGEQKPTTLCPEKLEKDFQSNFRKGRKIYLEAQAQEYKSNLNTKKYALKEKKSDYERAESTLRGAQLVTFNLNSLSPEARQQVEEQLRKQERDVQSKKSDYEETSQEVRGLESKLQKIEIELHTLQEAPSPSHSNNH